MIALVERIASRGSVTREDVRKQAVKPRAGRPQAFIFNYRPTTKAFTLKLKFRKGHVEQDEVISALEAIIEELRQQRGS